MKQIYWFALLGVLAVGGCIPESFLTKNDVEEKPVPQVHHQAKPRTFVTPDQVDEANCRDKEKMLRQELEMDEQDALKAEKK